MTEEQLEKEMLGWLSDIGYTHIYGPDIAIDGEVPERNNYQEVLLLETITPSDR
jgi:type I restriction enzyme R subunit